MKIRLLHFPVAVTVCFPCVFLAEGQSPLFRDDSAIQLLRKLRHNENFSNLATSDNFSPVPTTGYKVFAADTFAWKITALVIDYRYITGIFPLVRSS